MYDVIHIRERLFLGHSKNQGNKCEGVTRNNKAGAVDDKTCTHSQPPLPASQFFSFKPVGKGKATVLTKGEDPTTSS